MSRSAISARRGGFTLIEVLIVVVTIGILSALAIDSGLRELRRERVNGLVINLAGWIETVRRSALRGTSCTATITTGNLTAGSNLASADSIGCPKVAPLTVDENSTGMSFNVVSSATTVTFTPRGTRYPSGSDVTIIVSLNPVGPYRCILIKGLLGVIGLGKSDGTTCTPDQRF
jgi:prepilin-type N-terminal cleavage/methylation domain-containing protein